MFSCERRVIFKSCTADKMTLGYLCVKIVKKFLKYYKKKVVI